MSTSSFPCPFCHQPAKVGTFSETGEWVAGGGRWRKNNRQWVRVRTCSGSEQHEFETFETYPPSDRLADYQVERASDRGGKFQHKHLLEDVTLVLRGVLLGHQIAGIVDAAERGLLVELDARRENRMAPIPRRLITRQVSRAISALAGQHSVLEVDERRDYLRAHVLWTLARGEDGRLFDAAALLKWMEKEGYAGGVDDSPPHYGEVRVDEWHPLKADAAPQPQTVVFLVRTQIGDEEYSYQHVPKPYDHARLVQSVERALSGMPGQRRDANYVVQWCLWALAGQSVVRAADLASMVTQCLRKVDDLGYLSWVTRVRDLDIEQIRDEAVGLVQWPSPKLRFNPEIAADPRRQRNWDPLPLTN